MLGSILFNIFLGDLFLKLYDIDITCYADDNTHFKACGNFDAVAKTLRMSAEKLFKRFQNIQMKRNTEKYHLILSTEDLDPNWKFIN